MKKKLAVWMMCIGLGAALMTGCGKPTVESLLGGLMENPVESQTVEMDVSMVIKTISRSGEEGSDLVFESDAKLQAEGLSEDSDESACHLKGSMTSNVHVLINGLYLENGIPFETYAVTEGDEGTVYTYDNSNEGWYYSLVDLSDYGQLADRDTIEEIMEALLDAFKENGELAKNTETIEGIECYVITSSIDGDVLADAMEPLEDIFSDFMEESGAGDDIDLQVCMEYINMEVTFYISKEDGWLVKCEADLKDSDLYGLLEEIDTGMAATIINAFGDASFRECSFSFVFNGWNDTETEVPRSVTRDAVERPAGTGNFGDPEPSDREDGQMGESGRPDTKPGWEEVYEEEDQYEYVNPYPDGVPLYKSDEPDELLCLVHIPDEAEYIDFMSDVGRGYFYIGFVGNGIMEIRNEARFPLYDYLTYGSVSFEDADSQYEVSHQDYTCEIVGVVGTAFGGSDCIHVREYYYDVQFDVEFDTEYLVIEYDNNGSPEYLTLWMVAVDTSNWSDSDYTDLVRELFGE